MVKVITCTLCEEPYDLGDHEPVALPACGHTFCRLCLRKMKRGSAVLRCPNCRVVHSGPHPQHLPRNFSLLCCIEDQLKESDKNLENSTSVTSKVEDKDSEKDSDKKGDSNLQKKPSVTSKVEDKDSKEDSDKKGDSNLQKKPSVTSKVEDKDSEKESDKKGGHNMLKIGL
ncbi:RING finger protein 227-like, partial [Penaeus monodon]|uniref:RING finger protein 227-like n=1 Tax=Penaeus monodon TaxID=6687 RepID=UPI0018A746F5